MIYWANTAAFGYFSYIDCIRCFRFLAKDTRFDVVTGKECDKKAKRRQRAKSEKEIQYLDGVPYKRVAIGPGENLRSYNVTLNILL